MLAAAAAAPSKPPALLAVRRLLTFSIAVDLATIVVKAALFRVRQLVWPTAKPRRGWQENRSSQGNEANAGVRVQVGKV